MEFSTTKLSLAFTLTILVITNSVRGQDTPQDIVDAHNAAREEVGVQPIEWDDEVAKYAHEYAEKRAIDCGLVHSTGPYGENIAMMSLGDLTGVNAVKLWIDEKPMYDVESNTCVGGECRHYTQVVWSDTTYVGCAKVNCSNGGTFITCNYDPPGNYIDRRPFE